MSFVRRGFTLILTLLLISFVGFCLLQWAPGDFWNRLLLNPQVSPETVEQLKEQFGFHQSLGLQYWTWLKNLIQGEWGYSLLYHTDVYDLIMSRLFNTLFLMVSSLLLAWGLVIPLALYVSFYPYGKVDRVCLFFSTLSLSVPVFLVALIVVWAASLNVSFPLGGTHSLDYWSFPWWGKVIDRLAHLVLPCLVLVFSFWGGFYRVIRSYAIEQVESSYVMALRARGLSKRAILFKHVLRHVLNPLISLGGMQCSAILSGAAFVEIIFSWPGLGRLMLNAVLNQDMYLVMANLVLTSALLVLGNFVADILLKINDPRIRFGGKHYE